MLYIFINFACSLVEILSFYLIMTVSFERSIHSHAADVCLFLFSGICYGFFNDFGTAPTGAVLGILGELVWAHFCLKGKLSHKCFGTFLCYLWMVPSDWLTMTVASWCHVAGDVSITVAIMNNPPIRACLMMISKSLMMVMTMGYVSYRRYRKKETRLVSRFLYLLTGMIVVAIWSIAIPYLYADHLIVAEQYPRFVLVIPSAYAILYLFVLLLYFFLNRANTAAYHYEQALQKDKLEQCHYENMQLLEQELKHWKANTLQQLQILQSQISTGIGKDFHWQEDAIQSLLREENLVLTGNTVFDIIISQKIKQARGHGILLQANIQQIGALVMEETDIVCLMSNLLDNACEAVEKLAPENRQIYLEIRSQDDCLLIKTENPCRETVIDSKNRLRTTKSDNRLHGHGINCMKSVVEKYQGTLQYHVEHNIFTMKIFLQSCSGQNA